MSSKKKDIIKSNNFIQISGLLLEKNLVLKEDVQHELTDYSSGTGKKVMVKCDVIEKVEFMNPSLLIECSPKDEDKKTIGTYQIGVDYKGVGFGLASKAFDKDGNLIDNKNFKGARTVLNNYICKKDATEEEEATKVFVKSGFLSKNEYSKDGEYKTYTPKIEAYNVTSSGVLENDICEGTVTGYIRAIKDEIINEKETGRLKVDFYLFEYDGSAFPVEFVVEEDLADDFKDLYKSNDNCELFFDVTTKQVGGKKKKSSGGFGRRESKTVGGYLVNELSIFKGELPFEEENEKFVSKAEMKKVLEKRAVMIEQKNKKSKDKSKNKSNGGGIGKRKPNVSETKVDTKQADLPFDEDDDDELPTCF